MGSLSNVTRNVFGLSLRVPRVLNEDMLLEFEQIVFLMLLNGINFHHGVFWTLVNVVIPVFTVDIMSITFVFVVVLCFGKCTF